MKRSLRPKRRCCRSFFDAALKSPFYGTFTGCFVNRRFARNRFGLFMEYVMCFLPALNEK